MARLTPAERRELAALIRRVARPVDPRDVEALDRYLALLEGK